MGAVSLVWGANLVPRRGGAAAPQNKKSAKELVVEDLFSIFEVLLGVPTPSGARRNGQKDRFF